MRLLWRAILYLWVFFPATALGLIFLPVAMMSGGSVRVVRGAVEIEGRGVAWFLQKACAIFTPASAMTLGHVILGCDRQCLEMCRDHEQVHVRQYERWGPLFLPLYLGASLVIYLRGGDGYRDNPFEREAYGEG